MSEQPEPDEASGAPEPEAAEPEAAEPEAPEPEPEAEAPEPESAEDQGERRLRDLAAALAELDDVSISRGVATMREESRSEVAQALQMSKASMHLGEALAPLLRRKVLTVPPPRQLSVAFALAEEVNDEAIALLGDNSEDPSRAELDAAMPPLIESQGLPIVRLMVAAYAASDARCQAVMGELLDDDERFVLPDPPAPEDLQPDEVATITTFTATPTTRPRPRSARSARPRSPPSVKPRRARKRRRRQRRPHASRPSTRRTSRASGNPERGSSCSTR